MLASSSVFWMRCVCRCCSRTSCLRVRSRPRSSWVCGSGTKLAPDQAVRVTGRPASRIVHVALAPRHVLHVRRIGQHQLELAVVQDVPHRLPVHPRRLHRHVGARHGHPAIRPAPEDRAVVVLNVRTSASDRPPRQAGRTPRPSSCEHRGRHNAHEAPPSMPPCCAAGRESLSGNLITVLRGQSGPWRQSRVLWTAGSNSSPGFAATM